MTLRKRVQAFLLAAVLLLAMLPLTASAKDFPEVLAQAKKLGKQFAQLEAAGFAGAAFADKDELKLF